MSNERQPLWPWIVALLIGLPLLYVASFGAACALIERDVLPMSVLDAPVFSPCLNLATDGPGPVRTVVTTFVGYCGGGDVLARKTFELAPYRGITGGLFP